MQQWPGPTQACLCEVAAQPHARDGTGDQTPVASSLTLAMPCSAETCSLCPASSPCRLHSLQRWTCVLTPSPGQGPPHPRLSCQLQWEPLGAPPWASASAAPHSAAAVSPLDVSQGPLLQGWGLGCMGGEEWRAIRASKVELRLSPLGLGALCATADLHCWTLFSGQWVHPSSAVSLVAASELPAWHLTPAPCPSCSCGRHPCLAWLSSSPGLGPPSPPPSGDRTLTVTR